MPQERPITQTHDSRAASGSAAKLDGSNEQFQACRCATLRRNRPTWAVMGPGMSNSDIAAAWSEWDPS